jgi:hypothetical protein
VHPRVHGSVVTAQGRFRGPAWLRMRRRASLERRIKTVSTQAWGPPHSGLGRVATAEPLPRRDGRVAIIAPQVVNSYLPGGSVKRSLAMVFWAAPEGAIPKVFGFEAATGQSANHALNI